MRFIPQQRAGERPYLMIGDTSAYRLGRQHDWWAWEPEADEYVSTYGAQMTGPGGESEWDWYCLDMDTPIVHGGEVISDGLRKLADLSVISGELLDTTEWLMIRTPGHPLSSNPKGPGWQSWFRWYRSRPLRTGALPGAREIELKTTGTSPGSPGYEVKKAPEELPVLPEWIAERFGYSDGINRFTGEHGYSVEEWQVNLVKLWASPDIPSDKFILGFNSPELGGIPVIPFSDKRHIDQKVKAEEIARADLIRPRRKGRHRSVDWQTAPPEAQAVYAYVSGGVIDVGDPLLEEIDPAGCGRQWCSSRKHPLIATKDGKIMLMIDKPRASKYVRFPGWDEDRMDPLFGRQWQIGVLAEVVSQVYREAGEQNQRISQTRVAEIINNPMFRDEHDLWVYRAVSGSRVREAREFALHGPLASDPVHCKECRGCTGDIVTSERPDRYRDNHQWMCVPAKVVSDPMTPDLRAWALQFGDDRPSDVTTVGSITSASKDYEPPPAAPWDS